MDHRTDRRYEFEKEMFVHGIPPPLFHRIPGRRHNLRTLGASYAWLDAFRQCVESARFNEMCCFFDDDFQFIAPYARSPVLVQKLFQRILNEEADVILLSGYEELSPHNTDPLIEHSDFAWRAVDLIGEAALCARADYVKNVIINNVEEGIFLHEKAFNLTGSYVSAYCLDVYWTHLQVQDLWLFPKCAPSNQRPSWSNIVGAYVNNNSKIYDDKLTTTMIEHCLP